MPLTLGKHQVPSSSVAAGDWSSDPSSGTGKSIVMLVTNEGLADPRVLRSMKTAHRAGFEVRLVCRVPAKRSEEHTSELQSQSNLVCRLLLEKKKQKDLI